jgi:hypothetical protein
MCKWVSDGCGRNICCCIIFVPRYLGCFDPETEILMGDGKTLKKVKDIRTGDSVLNPLTQDALKVGKVYVGKESEPMIEITAGGSVVKVNKGHVMVTEAGLKKAIELMIGDKIGSYGKDWVAIDSIRQLPVDPAQEVYHFEAGTSSSWRDRVIVSNGLISGDRWLQDQMMLAPGGAADKVTAIPPPPAAPAIPTAVAGGKQ